MNQLYIIKYNINLNPTNFCDIKQSNPQYSLDINGSLRASQYFDYNGNLLTWGTGHTGIQGPQGDAVLILYERLQHKLIIF
jgi:hypothetical protein